MKKIMFYISTLGDGGAQRVIANLANYFSEKGYKTILVTEYPRKNEYFLDSSIKRIYLSNRKNEYSKIKKNIYWVQKIRKICKSERPNVLVSFMAEPNYRAIVATMGLKTKSVISVRNDPNYEYSGKIGRLLGKWLLPKADGCVFQTEEAKKWFPNRLQNKSVIIRNSVNNSFFEGKWDPKNSRAVAFGRLNKQKNYKMMIDAIRIVSQNGYNITLNIFGAGEEKESLKSYIEDNGLDGIVSLNGRTNNVVSELEKASIYLLTSNYEGMPNALMEAMAVGVPSISTDCPCGGPKDLLDGNCGILVPVGDSTQLASVIINLLGNAELSNTISRNAKNKARSFNPDTINKEWESYLISICKK